MNITVYLGASPGNSEIYRTAVEALGTWIGENGHRLIYGGSRTGLMGALAEAALAAGAPVTGVEPSFFVESELQLDGLTELIVTETMSERKLKMVELGDAFIAFPGGTGTLEEICEVISLSGIAVFKEGKNGRKQPPCILYNLNGYYDELQQLLEKMIREGFSTKERQSAVRFAGSLEEIAKILSE